MIPATSSVLDNSMAFVHGEKWLGIPSISFVDLVTGLAPTSSTLVSASLEFRPKGSRTIILTLVSPTHMTITSAAGWTLTVAERYMPELITGEYDYRFKTVDSNSRPQSWVDGIQLVTASYP